MRELFEDYWWLMFPLAWMALMLWSNWLRYLRHRSEIELMRAYAAQGRTPPPGLGGVYGPKGVS